MNLEERLAHDLRADFDSLDVGAGDPHRAVAAGTRISRRRTTLRGVAAASAVAAVAVTAGLALRPDGRTRDPEPAPAPAAPAGWTELPEAPLSPRSGSLAVWTGEEALFIGGVVANHCPPTADCVRPPTYGKDGAAYDPDTDTWRRIADAPFPVATHSAHGVAGDVVVVVGDDAWWGYDVSDDQWRQLPDPPAGDPTSVTGDPRLSAADGKVYAVTLSGEVQVLDVATSTWDVLPASPHRPRLEAHYVVGTPEGVVVIGVDATARNDGTEPSLLLADIYRDGTWERTAEAEILGGWTGWHWTGERLVSPYGECLDGGEVNNYGRCIPTGGALDPATGTWAALDPAPPTDSGGWVTGAADGPLVATWGSVYDDRDGSWTPIDPPAGQANVSESATAIADGRLIVFGGIDWTANRSIVGALGTNQAWIRDLS